MHVAGDISTCMYYTGIDPFTKQQVYVAKGLRDRKMQQALMQFFKPENWFTVREALLQARRQDLIGAGCDCLLTAQSPQEALEAQRRQANRAVQGDEDHDHYQTVTNPAKGEKLCERETSPVKRTGYRPEQKSPKRRHGKRGSS